MPGSGGSANMAAEMFEQEARPGVDGLHWATMPPGLARLNARVDSLEEHLRLALTEIRLLGDRASWVMREAEEAIDLAVELLAEERTADEVGATPAA